MQFPPHDVAITILWTILVGVAIGRQVIGFARRVMDAAKGWLACLEALLEGSVDAIVLIADGGEIRRRAWYIERAGVGTCALVVFVSIEDVSVDIVPL